MYHSRIGWMRLGYGGSVLQTKYPRLVGAIHCNSGVVLFDLVVAF